MEIICDCGKHIPDIQTFEIVKNNRVAECKLCGLRFDIYVSKKED